MRSRFKGPSNSPSPSAPAARTGW